MVSSPLLIESFDTSHKLATRDARARGAFTLLELVAVLVVMAILASAVAVSVRGHVTNARLEAFVNRLESFDERVRREARRQTKPLVMSFDADHRRVSQLDGDDSPSAAASSFPVPPGIEITKVKTIADQSTHGVLRIGVSTHGQTDSYALQLQTSSGREQWLLVLGGSGQCLRFDKEQDVERVFSLQVASASDHAG